MSTLVKSSTLTTSKYIDYAAVKDKKYIAIILITLTYKIITFTIITSIIIHILKSIKYLKVVSNFGFL